VAGFLFLCHGAQKILGVLGGFGHPGGTAPFMSVPWFAGVIELVGGTLIALGFLTSWVAFICSGEMAAAYFIVHQPNGALPILNDGELAALYAFLFLYISCRGGGMCSVDAALGRKS
jgi:putative oxidoreductase